MPDYNYVEFSTDDFDTVIGPMVGEKAPTRRAHVSASCSANASRRKAGVAARTEARATAELPGRCVARIARGTDTATPTRNPKGTRMFR